VPRDAVRASAFKNPVANPAHRPRQFRHFSKRRNIAHKHWFYDLTLARVQGSATAPDMTERVALYLRVSTGEQTATKRRLELEAWAARCGHTVTEVYEDHAIIGAKSNDQRLALARLLKDAVRRRFDMVAVWAVDRLGRSLTDLLNTLQTLKQSKVGLFLHQQGIDMSTAAGNAFFQMLGVFAEFERAIIVERVNAGIARARASGTKSGRPIGRPALKTKRLNAARAALAEGQSIRAAALAAGISVGSAAALRK
jgi:DNA invertase Pin-like site-specific DNA recombinase